MKIQFSLFLQILILLLDCSMFSECDEFGYIMSRILERREQSRKWTAYTDKYLEILLAYTAEKAKAVEMFLKGLNSSSSHFASKQNGKIATHNFCKDHRCR